MRYKATIKVVITNKEELEEAEKTLEFLKALKRSYRGFSQAVEIGDTIKILKKVIKDSKEQV